MEEEVEEQSWIFLDFVVKNSNLSKIVYGSF